MSSNNNKDVVDVLKTDAGAGSSGDLASFMEDGDDRRRRWRARVRTTVVHFRDVAQMKQIAQTSIGFFLSSCISLAVTRVQQK